MLILAIGYIIISALIVFNVEPDSFNSFFDAIYWATVSLTTMGYGDIYPVTEIGRLRCITRKCYCELTNITNSESDDK